MFGYSHILKMEVIHYFRLKPCITVTFYTKNVRHIIFTILVALNTPLKDVTT